jgi:hypothetical protein
MNNKSISERLSRGKNSRIERTVINIGSDGSLTNEDWIGMRYLAKHYVAYYTRGLELLKPELSKYVRFVARKLKTSMSVIVVTGSHSELFATSQAIGMDLRNTEAQRRKHKAVVKRALTLAGISTD